MKLTSITKYVVPVAILVVMYNQYQAGGWNALKADLMALPSRVGNWAYLKNMVMGLIVMVVGAMAVRKFVPAGVLRHAGVFIVTFVGFGYFIAGMKGVTYTFGTGTGTQTTGPAGTAQAATAKLQGM